MGRAVRARTWAQRGAMGISDRDYVRIGPRSTSGLGSLRFVSFNSWLILVNIVVFLAQVLLLGGSGLPVAVRSEVSAGFSGNGLIETPRRPDLSDASEADRSRVGNVLIARVFDPASREPVGVVHYNVMDPLAAVGHFSTALGFWPGMQVWRLVTFQFLHANLSHIFFNLFGLWIFGGMVESYLGFRRYAAFYLVCGICGGLAYLVLNFLGAIAGLNLPGVLVGDPRTPLIGASAGVFGVIVACAFISPNSIVQLLFPPIPLKMSWFAYGYVALAAVNLLRSGQNAGGDAAHLGGAIAGFFFVRNAHLLRDFFDVFGDSRRATPRRRAAVDPMEVDRILRKVRASGLVSLNDAERQTLRRATEQGRRA